MLPYLVCLWAFFCHTYPINQIRGLITSSVFFRYVRWLIKIWLIATFSYLIICLIFAFRTVSVPSSRLNQILSGIADCARRSSINRCNSQEYQCSLVQKECWALARCLSQSKEHTIVFEIVREWISQFRSSCYWFIALVSLYILLIAWFPEDVAMRDGNGAAPDTPPGSGQIGGATGNTLSTTTHTPAGPAGPNHGTAAPAIPAAPTVRHVSPAAPIGPDIVPANPAGLPPQPPPRRRVPRRRVPLLGRQNATLTEAEIVRLPGEVNQNIRLWRSGTYAEAIDENQPGHPVHGREAVGTLVPSPNAQDPSLFEDSTGRLFRIHTRVTGAVIRPTDARRVLQIFEGPREVNPNAESWVNLAARQRERLQESGYEAEPIAGRQEGWEPRGRLLPAPFPHHRAAFMDQMARRYVIVNSGTGLPIPVAEARQILGIRESERRNGEGDEGDQEEEDDAVWILDVAAVAGASEATTVSDPGFGEPFQAAPNANDPAAITEERLQRYNLTIRWHQGRVVTNAGLQRPTGRLEQPAGDAHPDPPNHWVDEVGRIFMIQSFRLNELTREHEHRTLPYDEVIQILNGPPPAAQTHEEFEHGAVSSTVREFWGTPEAQAYLPTRYNMWPGDLQALINDRRQVQDGPRTAVVLPQGRLRDRNAGDGYGVVRDEAGVGFYFYTRAEIPVSPQAVFDLLARVVPVTTALRQFFDTDEDARDYNLVEGGMFPILVSSMGQNGEPMRLPQGALRRSDDEGNHQLTRWVMVDETNSQFIVVDSDNLAQYPQDVLDFVERFPRFIRVTAAMREFFESDEAAEVHILVQNHMFPVPWNSLRDNHQPMQLPQGYLRRILPGPRALQHRLGPFMMTDATGTTLFLVYGDDRYAIDPDTVIAFEQEHDKALQAGNDRLAEWDRASVGTNNFVIANQMFSMAHTPNANELEEGEPRIHEGDFRADEADQSYLLDSAGARFRVHRRETFQRQDLASSLVPLAEILRLQREFYQVYGITPDDGQSASEEQDNEAGSLTGGEYPATEPPHEEHDDEFEDVDELEHPSTT
ncbi:hypothetical protein N431DRAFT_557424 [Stipitochalara longipes BDJ]|nr:hypothetical protein N431DRAFT_557424 [Stipitochalara longipes BDJ]